MSWRENERSTILAVDDHPVILDTLEEVLTAGYTVIKAESAESCLETLSGGVPNLILLDIGLPGMDGYELCREIRKQHDLPIIFVSAYDTVEERLMAFQAGGDDFVAKPFDADILRHKVERVLRPRLKIETLAVENEVMRHMAANLLDVTSENAILLRFLLDNLECQHHEDLYQRLVTIIGEFGFSGAVEFRPEGDSVRFSVGDQEITPLEDSLLSRGGTNVGVFLYKNRLLINREQVTCLITNFPADTSRASRLLAEFEMLIDAAESLMYTVSNRRETALTAENLQVATLDAYEALKELVEDYRQQQADTQVLLHGLIDKMERSYFSLGLTEGQEERISSLLRTETSAVMELFQIGVEEFDGKCSKIMETLVPPKKEVSQQDIWL